MLDDGPDVGIAEAYFDSVVNVACGVCSTTGHNWPSEVAVGRDSPVDANGASGCSDVSLGFV